jgi:hypothetical protein
MEKIAITRSASTVADEGVARDRAQFVAAIRSRLAPPSRLAAVEAVHGTAHWLLARGRPADAAKVFRAMLRIAPRDERGWLGLGECHERTNQPRVAAELYGAGSVIAGGEKSVSVRCLVARARALSKLNGGVDVAHILDAAEHAAGMQNDERLIALVANERRRLS